MKETGDSMTDTVENILSEPTHYVRGRRREPKTYTRCDCTRQHSCPLHSRAPTPYESAKAGPVVRDEKREPISATQARALPSTRGAPVVGEVEANEPPRFSRFAQTECWRTS
jgi:hypothetical protein